MNFSKSRSVNAIKEAELLSWVAVVVEEEAGLGKDRLGERVATRMGLELSGQNVYISTDRARRNRVIYADFDGQNYHVLAKKYHLSERYIRQIINDETNRRRIRQAVLPGVTQIAATGA